MSQLFLCFYGDSRLWENIILSTAYPKGFSYFRPFRYRDEWIDNALLQDLKNKEKRASLIGQSAILAMRFISEEHKWLVLPIRKVNITHIDYIPDNHGIYFKLGDMVDYPVEKELNKICFEIPSEEHGIKQESTLFFQSNVGATSSLKFYDSEEDEAAWIAYCNKVAKDTTLPINEKARNSLFMRFLKPTNGKNAKITQIHKSNRMGKIYGAKLTEGNNYELVIIHRTPVLIGSHTTLGRVTVNYESPSGHIELSRSEEDFTGNYQTHVVSITAKQPTGTWEELIIGPKEKEIIADDGRTINTLKLKIPVKVQTSLWYRFRKTGFLVLVLALVLTLGGIISGIGENGISGSLLIYQAILSAVASILIIVFGSKV